MLSKLGWSLRRNARDAELDQELRAHIEAEVEEQIEAGVPPQQARRAAMRAFGNHTLAVEEIRSMWRFTTLEAFAQDIQYGIRLLSPESALRPLHYCVARAGHWGDVCDFFALAAPIRREA